MPKLPINYEFRIRLGISQVQGLVFFWEDLFSFRGWSMDIGLGGLISALRSATANFPSDIYH